MRTSLLLLVAMGLPAVGCDQFFGQGEDDTTSSGNAVVVQATLTSNACGTDDALWPPTLEGTAGFTVVDGTIVWEQDGASFAGSISESGHFLIRDEREVEVIAAGSGQVGCYIEVAEVWEGDAKLVDSTSEDRSYDVDSLTGTQELTYTVVPGSDCSCVLGEQAPSGDDEWYGGGDSTCPADIAVAFNTLPCTAKWSMSGDAADQ